MLNLIQLEWSDHTIIPPCFAVSFDYTSIFLVTDSPLQMKVFEDNLAVTT